MGQYFGGKTYRNAFHSLRQEQWKFQGQGNRLLFPSIIRKLPLGGLWVKHHVQGKFGESGFNITCCGGTVTCSDIPPVSLGFNQQFLLAEVDDGITDGGIPMGVEIGRASCREREERA